MGKPLRVLIACEFTGTVRREFDKLGHDVWSCDLAEHLRAAGVAWEIE